MSERDPSPDATDAGNGGGNDNPPRPSRKRGGSPDPFATRRKENHPLPAAILNKHMSRNLVQSAVPQDVLDCVWTRKKGRERDELDLKEGILKKMVQQAHVRLLRSLSELEGMKENLFLSGGRRGGPGGSSEGRDSSSESAEHTRQFGERSTSVAIRAVKRKSETQGVTDFSYGDALHASLTKGANKLDAFECMLNEQTAPLHPVVGGEMRRIMMVDDRLDAKKLQLSQYATASDKVNQAIRLPSNIAALVPNPIAGSLRVLSRLGTLRRHKSKRFDEFGNDLLGDSPTPEQREEYYDDRTPSPVRPAHLANPRTRHTAMNEFHQSLREEEARIREEEKPAEEKEKSKNSRRSATGLQPMGFM